LQSIQKCTRLVNLARSLPRILLGLMAMLVPAYQVSVEFGRVDEARLHTLGRCLDPAPLDSPTYRTNDPRFCMGRRNSDKIAAGFGRAMMDRTGLRQLHQTNTAMDPEYHASLSSQTQHSTIARCRSPSKSPHTRSSRQRLATMDIKDLTPARKLFQKAGKVDLTHDHFPKT
jgi:hypothetical protein